MIAFKWWACSIDTLGVLIDMTARTASMTNIQHPISILEFKTDSEETRIYDDMDFWWCARGIIIVQHFRMEEFRFYFYSGNNTRHREGAAKDLRQDAFAFHRKCIYNGYTMVVFNPLLIAMREESGELWSDVAVWITQILLTTMIDDESNETQLRQHIWYFFPVQADPIVGWTLVAEDDYVLTSLYIRSRRSTWINVDKRSKALIKNSQHLISITDHSRTSRSFLNTQSLSL